MKTYRPTYKLAALSVLFFLLLPLVGWSPPANEDIIVNTGTPAAALGGGNNLSIGSHFRGVIAGATNASETFGLFSTITGNFNTVRAGSSVIGGNSNMIASAATSTTESLRYSGVFGFNNTVPVNRDSILVGGKSNTINASGTLVCGQDNMVNGPTTSAGAYHSAAIGQSNKISETYGWAIGYQNEVMGNRGVAIGSGTCAKNASSTALGKYNSEMETDDVLVVGNGTSNLPGAQSTALRIKNDASIVLGNATSGNVVLTKAQGDISMGIYGQ